MSRFRSRRPSAAILIACVALFVALGGTGYAAFSLPKNSVGTNQLKNKAVTTSKIKNGVVTASKINTSGLTVPNANHASSADNATNATNAQNASTLGGHPASAFESASNIVSAVVTNNGTTATVVRGTAGTTAQFQASGDVFVKFPSDVSNCTWIATVGNPGSTPVGPEFASVRGNSGAGPDVVQVLTWNTSGGEVAANFHVAAIC